MTARLDHRLRLASIALRRIRRYPIRSTLMLLCAAVGVAGVVAAANYAAGGRAGVLSQVERLGTRLITVTAEQSVRTANRGRTGDIVTTLREDDYRALREDFEEIVAHSALVSRSLRIKGAGRSRNATVQGVEPEYFGMKFWSLAQGEFFDEAAIRQSSRVAVIGNALAQDLFGSGYALGETLTVNRIPFEIVGVLDSRGTGLDGVNEDELVFIPLSTAMRRVMDVDYYAALLFEIDAAADIRAITADIEAVMTERQPPPAGREPDFKVRNSITLIEAELDSAKRLEFLGLWISLATLSLAGLGILAMSWIGTHERFREIGTLRALGATRGDIFQQLVFESGSLALLGTVAGVLLGWSGSVMMSQVFDFPYRFDSGTATLAVLVSAGLNVGFACWPAWRLVRVDPIDALQGGEPGGNLKADSLRPERKIG